MMLWDRDKPHKGFLLHVFRKSIENKMMVSKIAKLEIQLYHQNHGMKIVPDDEQRAPFN